MKFLIDTNIVIGLLKTTPREKLLPKVKAYDPTNIVTSVIVAHELFYGAFYSAKRDRNLRRFQALFRNIEPLPFTVEDAHAAGEVRARLRAIGKPIRSYDALIAGQAISRGLVLVTNNTREFARVDGLKVVDWLSEA